MLTALRLFKNIGQFDSAAFNLELTPLTLIYAENGRGKTTLAAILRSLSTGDPLPIAERRRLAAQDSPHVVLEGSGGPPPAIFINGSWNRPFPDIVVFDDTFVDENVSSGLTLGPDHRQQLHELILGTRGVTLNRRLQQAVSQNEEHNRLLRTTAEAISADKRGPFDVNEFCALAFRQDLEAEIQTTERNLAAARQRDQVAVASDFQKIILPEFDIAKLERLLGGTINDLDARAMDRVQAHLASLGTGGEAWVGVGMRLLRHPNEDHPQPCPFCTQELRGSPLIMHYRAYFGDEYTRLHVSIAETLVQLDQQYGGDALAGFERDFRAWVELRSFWSAFSEVPHTSVDTAVVAQAWTVARDEVRTLLTRKLGAPLDAISLTSAARAAIDVYTQKRRKVIDLSEELQAANRAIAVVKEQAAIQSTTGLVRDLISLRATKARYAPDMVARCDNYLAQKAAKASTEQDREQIRTDLDRYRQEIFPAFEVAINLYLQRFNAGFRLDHIVSVNTRGGPSCTYNVLISNESVPVGATATPGSPSFRTILSAGDRNTLALAFFFASLDQDSHLDSEIVVIDDPITSLDEHRSLTTVQEIRRLAGRAAQVIVLSHDKPFLCRIWENADTNIRTALEVVRDGLGSTIQRWNVNADLITEHDRRYAMFQAFLAAAAPNNRHVAEALRPHLEAFLRVAYPGEFPPGTLLGPFRNICQQRVGTGREVLGQRDIDELRELTEYANLFHHDSNSAWQTARINDAELLGFVQRVLDFVRL